jgi:hypothetical protein
MKKIERITISAAPSIPLITAPTDMGWARPRPARRTNSVSAPMPAPKAPTPSSEWAQFRGLRRRTATKQPVLVDLRNVYRPGDIEGFAYHGVGRVARSLSGEPSTVNVNCAGS